MHDRYAAIKMYAAFEGGLKAPMTTPTRSLLLRFEGQEAMAVRV